MSRIGRKPVAIPQGVDCHVGNGVVQVKGPRGSMLISLLPGIGANIEAGSLSLSRTAEDAKTRAFHGLNRVLISNATVGVSVGWRKQLEIIGIGYRAERDKDAVVFNLGYSHPIRFAIPEGIDVEVDSKANKLVVIGNDRQRVGQVAADIRGLRPPEPYKGKGIRYTGEKIRMKVGKKGVS
jgi:large subunit ribosomal protein L6